MSDVRNLCMELLAVEEKWRTLAGTSKKKLPDLGSAHANIQKANRSKLIKWIFVAAILAVAFLVVKPMLPVAGEDDSFEMTFFAGICKFGFWFILLCALGLVLWLGGIYGKVDETDNKADRTYAENKRFNEKLDADLAKAKEDHARILQMLRTEGQKGYFYDIPFDPAATYKTFRDGVEFYSSEMGNSFIGGPPVIYKYHEKQPVRLDGFHPGKSCKIKEAMDVLPDKDYVKICPDRKWIRENQEKECVLFGMWDMYQEPLKDRKIFKLGNLDLNQAIKTAVGTMSNAARFLSSGIDTYDPFIPQRISRSQVRDDRNETLEKERQDYHYGIVDEEDFEHLHYAYTFLLIEKGYLVICNGKLVCAALSNHPVGSLLMEFNIGKGQYKRWADYHGYLAKVDTSGKQANPDMASTIDYLTKYCGSYFPAFDPFMKKPEGMPDSLFRLLMAGWYRASQNKK